MKQRGHASADLGAGCEQAAHNRKTTLPANPDEDPVQAFGRVTQSNASAVHAHIEVEHDLERLLSLAGDPGQHVPEHVGAGAPRSDHDHGLE